MNFMDARPGFAQQVERRETALMDPIEVEAKSDVTRVGIVQDVVPLAGVVE